MSDLAAALQIVIKVHADQRDKQGEPYLLHVLRVVEAVSFEAKVVAALHDVFEDGDKLDNPVMPGLSGDEDGAVVWLTRTPNETYADYIKEITTAPGRQGKLAREVKLADLRDNLGRIPPWNARLSDPLWQERWGDLKARYEKALATLEATQ